MRKSDYFALRSGFITVGISFSSVLSFLVQQMSCACFGKHMLQNQDEFANSLVIDPLGYFVASYNNMIPLLSGD